METIINVTEDSFTQALKDAAGAAPERAKHPVPAFNKPEPGYGKIIFAFAPGLLGFGGGAIISSQIAGYYRNLAANDISEMFPAFVIASCCAVGALAIMLALKRMSAKKKA